jgi:glycosyltransferase involved in cell wall biosynthesis
MKFSIVTPCLNRANFLEAAIESVIAQGYPDVEHLIIDGGSTDGTLELLRKYPHLRVISEPDRGMYDAINKGIKLATGEVLIFLNSDDLLVPGALALSADIFRSAVGTMIVSAGCQIFRSASDGREIEMHRYDNPREYALSFRNVTIGRPNINARFIRRKVFDQIGTFDPRYAVAADREFLIRAALRQIPDAPVAKVLYRYRWHAGSLTMNPGNNSLLIGMQDAQQIIARSIQNQSLHREEVECLKQWGRECQATKVMIYFVQRRFLEALRAWIDGLRRDPRFLLTFIRLGLLAVGRRLRTWWRLKMQSTDRRVRVLYLIDSLSMGGAQTVLFNCLTYADPKYEIVLASLHANRNALFWERAHALGIPIVALSPYRWLPIYLLTLPWLLWRKRFDVVQCYLLWSNWLGKPMAKLFGVPLVISHDQCHEFRFAWPVVRDVDRWANGFADRILVISKSLQEKLRTIERVPEEKLIYMPNGVAATLRRSQRRAKGSKVIGAAGRLVNWKNFDRFLRLAQQLARIDHRYRFLIGGDGPQREALRKLAGRLGIADKLTWKGAMSSLDSFFDEIDLFVLTSDLEELPMVVLEAFAAEVPAAIVSVNWARELRAQEALCLDPNGDEAEWAQQINSLLNQPDRLAAMVGKARTLVDGEFSARAQMKEMERIYDSEFRIRNPEAGR